MRIVSFNSFKNLYMLHINITKLFMYLYNYFTNDLMIKQPRRELALKIKSLEHKGHLLFVTLEKTKAGTYSVFYKKQAQWQITPLVTS